MTFQSCKFTQLTEVLETSLEASFLLESYEALKVEVVSQISITSSLSIKYSFQLEHTEPYLLNLRCQPGDVFARANLLKQTFSFFQLFELFMGAQVRSTVKLNPILYFFSTEGLLKLLLGLHE